MNFGSALLLLPAFDLLVTIYFGISGYGASASGVVGPILGFLYHVFSWLLILLGLEVMLGAERSGSRIVRSMAVVLILLFLLPIFSYLIFYWTFLIGNGFPPSLDAVSFLLANLERLPQHILQTSPIAAIGLLLGSLVLSMFVLFMFHRQSLVSITGRGYRLLVFCGLAIVAWFATAPFPFLVTPVQSAVAGVFSPVTGSSQEFPQHSLSPSREYEPANLSSSERGPVVVILIESLRRDLLEMSPSPIPFLKSIMDESIFFDHAYATASHSNYADLAFWYSQYPLRKLNLQKYPKDAVWRGDSLFTTFKAHDFTTAYISSQNEKWGQMINWLDVEEVDYFYHSENFDGDTWLNEDDRFGIKMLMEKGVATAGKIEDSATLKIAEQWIDSLGGREDFFLGLNLQNTHFSYVIPHGGDQPFQPAELDFEAVYFRWPEAKKAQVKNRYLNAVYNVDRILREFSEFLKQKGLWNKTTFVVVGDSGEAFYEHGFGNHSGPMYEEVMRTFALIKPARGAAEQKGLKHISPVSHIDIAAAVLDLQKMPVPDSFQGISPLQRKQNKKIFMHTNAIVKQNGVIDWPWKLLHTNYPQDFVELYNLASDPAEQKNLVAERQDIVARLDNELVTWVTRQVLYYSGPEYYTIFSPPKILD